MKRKERKTFTLTLFPELRKPPDPGSRTGLTAIWFAGLSVQCMIC